jgi:hypothetical protein
MAPTFSNTHMTALSPITNPTLDGQINNDLPNEVGWYVSASCTTSPIITDIYYNLGDNGMVYPDGIAMVNVHIHQQQNTCPQSWQPMVYTQ